jgi:hypothetical protein
MVRAQSVFRHPADRLCCYLADTKPNPIYVMLGTGVLGAVWFFVENRVFPGS